MSIATHFDLVGSLKVKHVSQKLYQIYFRTVFSFFKLRSSMRRAIPSMATLPADDVFLLQKEHKHPLQFSIQTENLHLLPISRQTSVMISEN